LATEIELKLSILDDSVDALGSIKACLVEAGIAAEFQANKLNNVYFDTCGLRLNAEKIALRIRDKQGGYIQTLKTKGSSINGLSQRGEWEWSLGSSALDISLLQACDAWPKDIDLDTLKGVFETDFVRHQIEFEWGLSRIELALDLGEIKAGNSSDKIEEIELELKSGVANDLHSLHAQLGKNLKLAPSDISKAERGYRLFVR